MGTSIQSGQDADFTRLQRWLQRVATEPAGLQKGIERAQASLGLSAVQLGEVINESVGPSAQRRLGIYHNGYFSRLLQCMRAEFPLLYNALDNNWFDQMAMRYLAHMPSRSPNLNELGKHFPAFLHRDRPDKNEAEKSPAFDFIEQLAQLERYKSEIARGPGIEQLNLESLETVEHQDPASYDLALAPSVRLMQSDFALCPYMQPSYREQHPVPEQIPQYIALSRRNYGLLIREIEPWQFVFLCSLNRDGDKANDETCIAERLVGLAETYPRQGIVARAPFWLAECAEAGYFSRLIPLQKG